MPPVMLPATSLPLVELVTGSWVGSLLLVDGAGEVDFDGFGEPDGLAEVDFDGFGEVHGLWLPPYWHGGVQVLPYPSWVQGAPIGSQRHSPLGSWPQTYQWPWVPGRSSPWAVSAQKLPPVTGPGLAGVVAVAATGVRRKARPAVSASTRDSTREVTVDPRYILL